MRVILIGLWISTMMIACTSSEGNGGNTKQKREEPTVYRGEATTASADGVPQANKNGSFMTPSPLPDAETVELLTRDFWVFEYYVADEREVRLKNKGRWFAFFKDGTFETGRWTEKLGYGAWTLQEVPGKGLNLILDNVDDSQDEQWEIQGVNQTGDTMTWAGLNKSDNAGHVIKAINLLTRPTRSQFGAEDIE